MHAPTCGVRIRTEPNSEKQGVQLTRLASPPTANSIWQLQLLAFLCEHDSIFNLGVEPFLTFVSSTCRALVFLMQVQTCCLHRSSSVSHVCNGSVVFGIYVSYTVQLQRYSFDSYASTFPHQSSPLPAYKDAPHLYPPVHYEKVPMIGKGGSCSLGGNVATECKSMATLVAEHGVGT